MLLGCNCFKLCIFSASVAVDGRKPWNLCIWLDVKFLPLNQLSRTNFIGFPYTQPFFRILKKEIVLEIVLTPSNRTVKIVEASGGPETVTLTDGTPPDERMAFFISSALSILFPELRKIFICDLIVAAFL